MDHINSTKVALDIAGSQRLWVLKQATKRLSVAAIGAFCREVDASAAELAALIRDRAAQRGTRPPSDLII